MAMLEPDPARHRSWRASATPRSRSGAGPATPLRLRPLDLDPIPAGGAHSRAAGPTRSRVWERWQPSPMNRGVVGILCLTLLAGCASERWIYERPGLTPAKLDQDLEVVPSRGAPAVLVRRLALGPRRIGTS